MILILFLLILSPANAQEPVQHGDSGRMAVQVYRAKTYQIKEIDSSDVGKSVDTSTETMRLDK